ncbi:lauroyl-Kdo(2)-lipid IV(A) myristoyltransferase [Vibrio vulnificus]|uniref:lauroyl-Kdo(2)-lipid IV(A) myristoyltransferase n=1 Tax=Vibrio vulnificus TaxID=672 RepID=UPI00165E1B3C|nr:lauroyl-Kdo(2)-lipid IV(A) myristoyltransferase [Vibrio vulnificus]EGR9009181.1 lauroyl-Kdo(2)-lipid IV(A) myristoyltransferase [Vibrio vulnificus]EHU9459504.1 lauroyl-Kdo(2)-lipid IV(A) myristoyltransferase [Vibrio vulnificus]EJE8580962.1 lauroyl-Kdo(2)-lipid IV(A) myristoyltransferase [Vibrio vulnificus]MCG6270831.1 lauroyl-Kdo(2)-lipid IV(A) myristoyltransferase [Vibrio vulnificus]MCG6285674.1 lauroyl-Kdo(2)-lipid IV(A) myristoyltransferase [Vibrio vulnificus]
MKTERNDFDPKAYHPTFQWGFLAPKYWGTWIAILFAIPITFLPVSIKRRIARTIAKVLIKKRKGTIHNAWVNLHLCFPERSHEEREQILFRCLETAGIYLLTFASLTTRSKKWLTRNTNIKGMEHLQAVLDRKSNVILMVPHTWTIDIPAIVLASRGLPVVGFSKPQKNALTDWLMHRQRVQYGGKIFERDAGVNHFIRAIRKGYLGYYLADQDHGREQRSVFVDFFAATKATLPGVGKLTKVAKAEVVPMVSKLNVDTGQFDVEFFPAWEHFPTENEETDARKMNAHIENVIAESPEQYMWIFQLLRTQEDKTAPNPYRDPRYMD